MAYLGRVHDGRPNPFARVDPAREGGWRAYARDPLAFNLLVFLAVYGRDRLEHLLRDSRAPLPSFTQALAFDTAVSSVTTANSQGCGARRRCRTARR